MFWDEKYLLNLLQFGYVCSWLEWGVSWVFDFSWRMVMPCTRWGRGEGNRLCGNGIGLDIFEQDLVLQVEVRSRQLGIQVEFSGKVKDSFHFFFFGRCFSSTRCGPCNVEKVLKNQAKISAFIELKFQWGKMKMRSHHYLSVGILYCMVWLKILLAFKI